jgi:hypothetical protein
LLLLLIIQSYSNGRKANISLLQLSNGLRLVILVHVALRTPKATFLSPAVLEIRARADTTAAVGRHDTGCILRGTLPQRLDFTDHRAVFLGTAICHGEAGFAAALRMSRTATGSRLALPHQTHSRVNKKKDEKEERKETREFVAHVLPMRVACRIGFYSYGGFCFMMLLRLAPH